MLNIIILAAGQGKRMYSSLPKVLQPLAGRPLLAHVIAAAKALSPQAIYIVHGHEGEQVKAAFPDDNLIWVPQTEQNGTAHAVQQVLPYLADDSTCLILYGDVPLVEVSTLKALYHALPSKSLALLVAKVDNPSGLGRIIRNASDQVQAIVEEKDATPAQRAIQEIYSGLMVADTANLRRWLSLINNHNAQQEFYLTAVPELAIQEGYSINTVSAPSSFEILGVNTKAQLAHVERIFQREQAEKLMAKGVTLADPHRFDLRGQLSVGQDVFIDVNVIIEGSVTLGHGVRIGANTVLRSVQIADNVLIKENCVIEDAQIGQSCIVGPFSRIRPGTQLDSHVLVGNFVEVKKSCIREGSKLSHLSYIGDAQIGKHVNIGAGTITCNYDGINKHETTIGDYAFIGSNSSLIAPIDIGEHATVGAGSTVTKAVPSQQLTVARTKQVTIKGWHRPEKKIKEA